MASITIEQARVHLNAWLDAELKVTSNQSYTLGRRTLTRANLSEIRKQIEYWRSMVERLENTSKMKGRNRVRRVVIRDL